MRNRNPASETKALDSLLTAPVPTSKLQDFFRLALGGALTLAGIGHLSFLRTEFYAQVPRWVPLSPDLTVALSGCVEIGLGLLTAFPGRHKTFAGISLAIFFVLIFPGNIAQFANQVDAFGLDSDAKRLARLFFQPVLILWALWSTGALSALRGRC